MIGLVFEDLSLLDFGSTQFVRHDITGESAIVFSVRAPSKSLPGGPFMLDSRDDHSFLRGQGCDQDRVNFKSLKDYLYKFPNPAMLV